MESTLLQVISFVRPREHENNAWKTPLSRRQVSLPNPRGCLSLHYGITKSYDQKHSIPKNGCKLTNRTERTNLK